MTAHCPGRDDCYDGRAESIEAVLTGNLTERQQSSNERMETVACPAEAAYALQPMLWKIGLGVARGLRIARFTRRGRTNRHPKPIAIARTLTSSAAS